MRVNAQKIAPADYLARLEAEGITATTAGDFGVTLQSALPVSQIPLFFDGFASVQDQSAQIAGTVAAVTKGLCVLDVCSAPGSKACHLAELGAQVTAMDVSPSRLQSVEDNAQRLGLSIKTVVGDGRDLTAPAVGDNFDLVLLDVPCSATGVMRRNPDVKLIRLKTDIPQFAALQTELLQSAWQKVRPGGKLLYVTCSLMPAENEDLVSDFVDVTNDAQVIPLSESIGIEKKVGRQTLPSASGGDGPVSAGRRW